MTQVLNKGQILPDQQATGWSIAISVLMIVAGLLAILVPSAAGLTVTLVVGWLLVINGIGHFVFGWHARGAGGVMWEVLIGLLYVIAGAYLLIHPFMGLESLTLMLAIYFVVKGGLEFLLSFQLRPLLGSGWLMLDGIITFILAIIIWRTWPLSSLWVMGMLIGISMLFGGIARLMISLTARRLLSVKSA